MKKHNRTLNLINDAISQVMVKGSDEAKLLAAMSRLPRKYNFGDNPVELVITVDLCIGEIRISRYRNHGCSTGFQVSYHCGNVMKELEYKEGRWRFVEE